LKTFYRIAYFCPMAGIYIHIPFCKQACHYCDFHFSTSLAYKNDLLSALNKEIILQKNYLGGNRIETIYFGGGTPSLLHSGEINAIIDAIAKLHSISSTAEITLEANPDDLDKKQVQAIKGTAVNRFSIGIQSFFDEDLKWMNRAHQAGDADSSVKRAQDAGFENITVDLIYGYPLLTDAKWKSNIDRVFELEVPHVSAYSMTVEPRTALAAFIKKKTELALNDEQSASQFIHLMDAMNRQGFEHYEISNFCKPGSYSRHNTNYWKGVNYLGIGPSAHSYNGDSRQWNISNNAKYIKSILELKVPAEKEILSGTDKLNEYIMTSLRTQWGLDLQKLNTISAGASTLVIRSAEEFFAKEWLRRENEIIYLSQSGKLYADHIASELFF